MSICEKCHKDIRNKRRHRFRCKGKKQSKPKKPVLNKGTGITPSNGKIVLVGGNEEQRKIVQASIDRGELDE